MIYRYKLDKIQQLCEAGQGFVLCLVKLNTIYVNALIVPDRDIDTALLPFSIQLQDSLAPSVQNFHTECPFSVLQCHVVMILDGSSTLRNPVPKLLCLNTT